MAHTYNVVVESKTTPGHHELAPGAWMPHASALVPVDEFVDPWAWRPTLAFVVAADDEDLLPWERRIKSRLLGS